MRKEGGIKLNWIEVNAAGQSYRKHYSPTKSLVPPTILVKVRCRVRVLKSSGRNKRFSGIAIGTRKLCNMTMWYKVATSSLLFTCIIEQCSTVECNTVYCCFKKYWKLKGRLRTISLNCIVLSNLKSNTRIDEMRWVIPFHLQFDQFYFHNRHMQTFK